MSISMHIRDVAKIDAVADPLSGGRDGATLDLTIRSGDGDVELTLYFDSLALARAYADAISAARVVRKLEVA